MEVEGAKKNFEEESKGNEGDQDMDAYQQIIKKNEKNKGQVTKSTLVRLAVECPIAHTSVEAKESCDSSWRAKLL